MLRTTLITLGAAWVARHQNALKTVAKFAGADWKELGVDLHMRTFDDFYRIALSRKRT